MAKILIPNFFHKPNYQMHTSVICREPEIESRYFIKKKNSQMKLDLHILFNQVDMDNELIGKKKGITEIYVCVYIR